MHIVELDGELSSCLLELWWFERVVRKCLTRLNWQTTQAFPLYLPSPEPLPDVGGEYLEVLRQHPGLLSGDLADTNHWSPDSPDYSSDSGGYYSSGGYFSEDLSDEQ